MLACKGIFARPSIPQASEASGREGGHSLQKSREFCGYYTTPVTGSKEILKWVGLGGISVPFFNYFSDRFPNLILW